MTRKMIVPLVFGVVGVAILVSLGVWQLRRLAWKEGILHDIETRIAAAPVALPDQPDPVRDRYLPVVVHGRLGGPEIDVLVSRKQIGAGYRIIQALDTGARRVLVDRGFVRERDRERPRPGGEMTVTGNLHWPDETDSFTPAPDLKAKIWFARDVAAMAKFLETEPVLVVARSDTGDGIEPMPVDTSGIPNDHLQYAITWFLLAAAWTGMTALQLWRIKRRNS